MATGGVENETLDTDICNCTICLDTFKVPKILPCLHTFCQSCINTYILSTKGETSPPDYFLCPICRTEVKPPNPKAPVEEWAKLLPLNQTIATLVDNSATEETPGEKKCDPCRREGELAQAEFWCFECEDGLCHVCHKYHKRMRSSFNHKAVPINDLNSDEFQDKKVDIEEPCFKHPGEHLKVYCVDHQKMCCVLCLSIDHRKCENIKTFDEMAESLKESDKTQSLAKTMKTFGQKMEEIIIKKQENIEGLGQQKQDILEDLAKVIEQAKEKLDKCYEDFKIHVSQTHKEQTTRLVETKDKFEIFQKSFENCEKMLHTVLKHGSLKQIFITSEKIKERLEIQARELQVLLLNDEDIVYDVNVDKHLTEVNTSMKSIAKLNLEKKVANGSALSFINSFLSAKYNVTLLQHRLKTAKICDLKAVKVFEVTKGNYFTDAVFLDDGTLFCVDCNAKALSVLNNKGKLLFSHNVDYTPYGVAQSSDGKIFVSDISTPGFRIYTFEEQNLQEICFIKTKENYSFAFDVVQDNIVVVQRSRVTLLKADGIRRREVGKCHEYSYIAVSKSDQNSLYCCDENCVVQYTSDGKEVMRLELRDVAAARGIAVDNNGNIYVCGKDSQNVVIITKDGLSIHTVLSKTDFSFKPYSIGFDRSGTRFFLTGFRKGIIAVYELCAKR